MQIIGRAIRKAMGASTLIGDDVKNQSGENLAKIEEIVLDVPSGTVEYAVLSFGGGFLGIGDKLFAVPWSVLQLDEDNKCFILNVSKDKLENAPGFDKKNWPDFADAEFGGQIYNYYGIERLSTTAGNKKR